MIYRVYYKQKTADQDNADLETMVLVKWNTPSPPPLDKAIALLQRLNGKNFIESSVRIGKRRTMSEPGLRVYPLE